MKRRDFIKTASMAACTAAIGFPNIISSKSITNKMFVGTPVLPEYLYEKGIANTLDAMKEIAHINTVMTFSHDFNFRMYSPNAAPKTDAEGNPLTNIFVKTNSEYYTNKAFADRNKNTKYSDRDILDELYEETQSRGMKVYARILEPYKINGAISNFQEFAEIEADNKKGSNVCFNNPGYRDYWRSVIEDLIRSHPYLHGFKYGQERGGPLLTSLGGGKGTCFCQHCLKLASEGQISIERARKGFLALKDFGDKIRTENKKPVEGFFVSVLKIISEFPEVLSWEKLWMDSREEQKKIMYRQIKKINENVEVGWHIDHGMTWDLITRTFWDYSKMGPYSDWLSVAVYFDSMGRRSRNHYNKYYRSILFGDAEESLSYPMYLSMLGYDPKNQPQLIEHERKDTSFNTEYVYNECQRAVKLVNGSAKVYARPGFDMPGYDCDVQPNEVHKAVEYAMKAGVDGLWCGREWDELQLKNAEAFGKAVYKYL